MNLGLLEEQPVLFPTAPSLQPHDVFFLRQSQFWLKIQLLPLLLRAGRLTPSSHFIFPRGFSVPVPLQTDYASGELSTDGIELVTYLEPGLLIGAKKYLLIT